MAQVLIRGLTQRAVIRMKQKAKSNGRSLEAELKLLIEKVASQKSREEVMRDAARLRKSLKGKVFPDVTALIREDRDR